MTVMHVLIFLAVIIIFMAFFIALTKYTIDSCVAHIENLKNNYPRFYSENRASMSRFGGKRKFFAEYSEGGGQEIQIAMQRVLFPIIRSDESRMEYQSLKKDPLYRRVRRLLLIPFIPFLLLFIGNFIGVFGAF